MTRRRKPGLLTAALATLLVPLLGGQCGPTGGGFGDPDEPMAGVRIAPVLVYNMGGGGYLLKVAVIATTTLPLQALDLTLAWNAAIFEAAVAQPHPDFDDDDQFFGQAEIDLPARTAHFVDLRHGNASPTGEVTVASVWLFTTSGGSVTIRADGVLASETGVSFKVFTSEALTFPVTP